MLRIDPSYIQKANEATTAEQLHVLLQRAIELEHATIPPYLTALYSIRPGQNQEVADLIRSVAIQEMLHMAIAANVLNAIGGHPRIADPKFVPDYPTTLPMNIGDGLVVGLNKLSRDTVGNVFMKIEEPETPDDFPVKPFARKLVTPEGVAPEPFTPEFATIGQFYEALIQAIARLGKQIFVKSSPQVVNPQWFPETVLFAVTNPEQACAALEIIRVQGEGTRQDPFDSGGKEVLEVIWARGKDTPQSLPKAQHEQLAHYYRFAEIFYGRRLIATPGSTQGYAYAGAPVPLDPFGVWDLVPNAKAERWAPGTQPRTDADLFNRSYSSLLQALDNTFNGRPDALNSTIGIMYEMRLLAIRLIQHIDPETRKNCAPPFQFVPHPV
jgi:hypothetical protein